MLPEILGIFLTSLPLHCLYCNSVVKSWQFYLHNSIPLAFTYFFLISLLFYYFWLSVVYRGRLQASNWLPFFLVNPCFILSSPEHTSDHVAPLLRKGQRLTLLACLNPCLFFQAFRTLHLRAVLSSTNALYNCSYVSETYQFKA